MGGIKRAIMDGIGQRFTLWGSGITGDKNCSLSVSFRLMTNIWVGPKVFTAYQGLVWCMHVHDLERGASLLSGETL